MLMKLNQIFKPTPMKGDVVSVLVSQTDSSSASKMCSESYTPNIHEIEFCTTKESSLAITSLLPTSIQA